MSYSILILIIILLTMYPKFPSIKNSKRKYYIVKTECVLVEYTLY